MSALPYSFDEAEQVYGAGLAGADPDAKALTARFANAMIDALGSEEEFAAETMMQGALRAAAIFVMLNSLPRRQAVNIRIAASLLVRIAAEIDVTLGTPVGVLMPPVSRRVQ